MPLDEEFRRDMVSDIRGSIESVERFDFPELFNEIELDDLKELLADRTGYLLSEYNLESIPNADAAQFGVLLAIVQTACREIPLFGDWIRASLIARGIGPRNMP